ncbi:KAP family P-loop NTPase fold protein [Lacihabitans lacunae]|uniref:P-loop NTPase fold protein n=1 Tax=Lacihabitans lacunae TaxID=1028214 RepID=A0ABV7YZB6_9BACT
MPKKSIITPLIKSIVIVGLYFLFQEPIELLLNKLIINPFLIHFQGSILKDLIVLTFILILGWLKFQNKLGSFEHLVTILLVSFVIYLPYRLNYIDIWSFEPLKTFKVLKYSDGLFLLFLILVYPKMEIIKDNSKNTLFEDLPLKSKNGDTDILNHESYANEIADRIKENNFEKSFAVGINGKWGSGKTSFISMIRENLEKNDAVTVEFNPWSSKNEESISVDFFEELDKKLIENQFLFGNLIKSYSNKIINKNSNQFFNWLNPFYSSTQPESYLKTRLEKSIKQIKNKVIVIIDDLDRLNKSEILEVLKIIRNTANFQNLIFVVAYDREFIRIQLNDNSNGEYNQYLEKIFQLEINLPHFGKEILRSKLIRNVKKMLENQLLVESNQYRKTIIITTLKKINESVNEIIPTKLNLIDTLRDVSRLSNSIALNIIPLIGEVDLKDFIILETIRIKEPEIYDLIKDNKLGLLTKQNINGKIFYYFKSSTETKRRHLNDQFLKNLNEQDQQDEVFQSHLQMVLKHKYKNDAITREKTGLIESNLNLLFGEAYSISDLMQVNKIDEVLAIRIPSRFDIYFQFSLSKNELPILRLKNERRNNLENYKGLINNLVENKLQFQVNEHLEGINAFDSYYDFQNVISVIFFFATLRSKIQYHHHNNLVYFDIGNIFQKIFNYYELVRKQETINEEKYRSFLKHIFVPREINESAIFNSSFLNYSYANIKEIGFSKEEILDMNIEILRRYSFKINQIDQTLIGLFRNTNTKLEIGKEIMPEKAIEIVKVVIRKDIKHFVENTFGKESRTNNYYYINPHILNIFICWESYLTFIGEYNKEGWFFEYSSFLEKSKKSDFNKAVEFDFTKLNPENNKITF